MNYWLVKFAPFRYSWKDVLRNGKFEIYSVRNAQARNNLKKMKLDDQVLFYHSQEGKCVMGRMKVIEEAHQDKTTSDERWVSVTFEPIFSFSSPVMLSQIRQEISLNNLALFRQPRLSVMALYQAEFELINEIGSQ